MTEPVTRPPEVAFYYPGHLWASSEWAKTMLLYFDGIAMLVPSHKHGDLEREFPEIAIPLTEQGLLHTVVPEQAVDAAATRQLADALLPIIESGALDDLDRSAERFSTLSNSRLGFAGDQALAGRLHEALKARGLSRDGGEFSFPIQEQVRVLVLSLVAQILRTRSGGGSGTGQISLQPATDQAEVVARLSSLLALGPMPSAGRVVRTDFEQVGIDLRRIPLDEVLDFRNQHGADYRRYARGVRKFMRDLSLYDDAQQREALDDRREELADLAAALRQRSTRAWRQPANLLLNVAGALWTVHSGDLWGGLLAAATHLTGADPAEPSTAGAYSYLFSANERFGGA